MEQEEKEAVTGTIITNIILFCYWIILTAVLCMRDKGDISMTDTIIVGIIGCCSTVFSGVLSALITNHHSKKSLINKNTEAINNLINQIGAKDEETLNHSLTNQYKNIIDDIGRKSGASLTEQHNNILYAVTVNYSEIKERFEKQDNLYRNFTSKQLDIKQTLDNFSRDYEERIKHEHELSWENDKLYNENYRLNNENHRLNDEVSVLRKQIADLKIELQRYQNRGSDRGR